MTEPMGSRRRGRLPPAQRAGGQHVKVAQSGQGADEVFAGYGYHQPLATVARHDAAGTFTDAFFDRGHPELTRIVGPAYAIDADASGDLVAAELGAPGAETALDAVLRLDTHLMLPDDPVKRVDSMSMAWGLEVRTPFLDQDLVTLAAACPPEHKVAQGGKGVLKAIARQVLPRGSRPTQGGTSRCRPCATSTGRSATGRRGACGRRPRADGGFSIGYVTGCSLSRPAQAAAGATSCGSSVLLELGQYPRGPPEGRTAVAAGTDRRSCPAVSDLCPIRPRYAASNGVVCAAGVQDCCTS